MPTLDPIPWQLLGLRTTGDIGQYTLYTNRKGSLVVFLKTRPRVPFTNRQLSNMRRFTAIAATWRAMPDAQRQKWRDATRLANLRITPYNLYVYAMMTPSENVLATISRQTGIDLSVMT